MACKSKSRPREQQIRSLLTFGLHFYATSRSRRTKVAMFRARVFERSGPKRCIPARLMTNNRVDFSNRYNCRPESFTSLIEIAPSKFPTRGSHDCCGRRGKERFYLTDIRRMRCRNFINRFESETMLDLRSWVRRENPWQLTKWRQAFGR